MNWNKLALCGAVAGSLAAVGCGSPPVTRDTGTPEGDAPMMAPVSQTYIISAISIPDAPGGPMMDQAPGFNLDGMVTGTVATPANCQEAFPDFISPTGEVGVDNQFTGMLASLLGSLGDVNIQMTVDEQIATGALLLALTVNDINSFENDGSVTLDLALVKPASCMMDTCPPDGGMVSAGAMWTVTMPVASGLAATITDGELRGMVPALNLMFDVSGSMIALTIRNATIGGDISADGLNNAAIGGVLRIEDIVNTLRSVPDLMSFADTAAGILPDYADVEPSAMDPLECLSISIGLGMTGVTGDLT